MARPQIRRRRDKPTSSVGRDESINHGTVIPHAERLRARRVLPLCRLFSLAVEKSLGKNIRPRRKNVLKTSLLFLKFPLLFTIFLFFSFFLLFSRILQRTIVIDIAVVCHVLSRHPYPWTLRRSHVRRILFLARGIVPFVLSLLGPRLIAVSRHIIGRVTVYGSWKRFIASHDHGLLTILRFDSLILYVLLRKYPYSEVSRVMTRVRLANTGD